LAQALKKASASPVSTKAESKFNVTIIDNFTLETYQCYSNIN